MKLSVILTNVTIQKIVIAIDTKLFEIVRVYVFTCLVWFAFDSYLLQCFQDLIHFQSISQCRGSRIFNCITTKTVKESVQELQEHGISKCNRKTFSLQLTSVLQVTCFALVLWPKLWLQ